jgi:anti-anti-sigma factor
MDICRQNGVLKVTGIRELTSDNTHSFHAAVATAFALDLQTIVIDLSQTHTVDGAGLGALVSLYEMANQPQSRDSVAIQLTNPTPEVQQIIELARLHHLFEITSPGTPSGGAPPWSTGIAK